MELIFIAECEISAQESIIYCQYYVFFEKGTCLRRIRNWRRAHITRWQ